MHMYARTHTAIADRNNEPSPVHKMTESLVSNKSRQISQLFHFMDLSGTFGSASFLRDDELSGTLLHLLLLFFSSFFQGPRVSTAGTVKREHILLTNLFISPK